MIGLRVSVPGRPPAKSNSYRVVLVRGHPRVMPTAAIKKYEASVAAATAVATNNTLWFPKPTRVELVIVWHRGDNRRKDIDNIGKAIMDGLTAGGVWADDSQVEHLHTLTLRDARGADNEWVDIYLLPITNGA